MKEDINIALNLNGANYAKKLISRANLDLVHATNKGKYLEGKYVDLEKNISAYLNKEGGKLHFVISNTDIVNKDGDYRVGLFEYSDGKKFCLYFNYFGLGACIHVRVSSNDISIEYSYGDTVYEANINCKSENEIIYEPMNGEPIVYSDVTLDQVISIIHDAYKEILTIKNINSVDVAEEKFILAEPVLKQAISETFAIFHKDRIDNWKNDMTGNIIEKCAGYIKDKESCECVENDIFYKKITYQNDEIKMEVNDLNTDYSSIVISFVDEESQAKKNMVRIQRNNDPGREYLNVIFDLANGKYFGIRREGFNKINIETLNGQFIKCDRKNYEKFSWFENNPSRRGELYIDDYSAQEFANKIQWAVTTDAENNPKFDRLFEIIKPILVLSKIEISINRVELLYLNLRNNLEVINNIGKLIESKEYNDTFNYRLEEERTALLGDNELLKETIDDIQCSVWEDYNSLINETRKVK